MNALVLAAFSGTGAQIGIVILVVLGVGALAASLMSVFAKDPSLKTRLSDYNAVTNAQGELIVPEDTSYVETDILQSAVDATGRLAERAGLLTKVEKLLEQAEVPLRPAEGVFFLLAAIFIISALTLFLAPSPFVVLFVAPLVAVAPVIFLRFKRAKRLRAFEQALPDTLKLLSGSMRAGFSFMQGLEAISQETIEPMRGELERVFNEARLGREVEDALSDSAERMESEDLEWAVIAIGIQREVGGNLAELLETVAETMQERERLRREVRALTAEGRFSSYVLGIFPIAFAGVLYVMRPDYIGQLFSNTGGVIAVIAAGILSLFGFWWLMKIVKIEV